MTIIGNPNFLRINYLMGLLVFFLSACCADRAGLKPVADVYEVSCGVSIDYEMNGVPVTEKLVEKQKGFDITPPDESLVKLQDQKIEYYENE